MPMTPKQLEQVEDDYRGFVPPSWKVIEVEQRWTSYADDKAELQCGVCGDRLDPDAVHKRITWRPSAAIGLTHVSALVHRNGVACRRRQAERAV